MSLADIIRVATFNVSMESRNYVSTEDQEDAGSLSAKVLQAALADKNHPQIRNIAEIIQRVRPDILLLNEFDYIADPKKGVDAFQNNFLAQPQNEQEAIHYPFFYLAPFNTGVLAGHDLDGDGKQRLPNDAHGFGYYPGHYGMLLLSKFPIDHASVRTFAHFKWSDMPEPLEPRSPDGKPYYCAAAWKSLRLSSKSHWDIPVKVGKRSIHILASHPTPPVFDGEENANGKRNHDEIRFWRDYVDSDKKVASYIYDDSGKRGGLSSSAAFIVLGDLNASLHSDSAITAGIKGLLQHQRVFQFDAPLSVGGKINKPHDRYSAEHTAAWGARADYVIPSKQGLSIIDTGVFWPEPSSKLFYLVKDRASSSDHRLVWMDLKTLSN